MTFQVGYTRRSGPSPAQGPLRHIHTRTPASPTGRNVLALCGASIRPRPLLIPGSATPVPWHPEHPRSCPRCRALVER